MPGVALIESDMSCPGRTLLCAVAIAAAVVLADGVPSAATASASAPASAGPESFTPSVVGGATATPGAFAWAAFVYSYEGNVVSQCTGSVVAPTVILTAAHCVISELTGLPLGPGAFGVVTGTVTWPEAAGRTVSGVRRVIVNPSFDAASGRDDAALLILGAPTTAPALPLQSATDPSPSTPGTAAVFAGWGQTNGTDSMSGANTLQWAATQIQSPGYCQDSLAPFDPQTQLCAHAPAHDTSVCFGDSGGPLIATVPGGEAVQVGVVRGSPGQCDPSGDAVFTSVPAISAWASAKIAAVANESAVAVTPPPLPFAVALSRLSVSAAESYVEQILSGRFGTQFRTDQGYTARCSQPRAYRVRCAVRWHSGFTSYWGRVSVFYVVADGSALWSNHYRIKWVNARCWSHGVTGACRVSRARGTYRGSTSFTRFAVSRFRLRSASRGEGHD
jgi:hypothetical protein